MLPLRDLAIQHQEVHHLPKDPLASVMLLSFVHSLVSATSTAAFPCRFLSPSLGGLAAPYLATLLHVYTTVFIFPLAQARGDTVSGFASLAGTLEHIRLRNPCNPIPTDTS